MEQVNEMLVNFISSIKKGSSIKLLPVSSRQCFVFDHAGELLGCIILGDLTHFIGLEVGKTVVSAHEYIVTSYETTNDIDDILQEWDYQTFAGITAKQWLNLVSYTN